MPDFNAFTLVSLTEFTWMLMEHIEQTYSDSQYYQLNQLDRKKINLLRDNKYSTWDWNYGLSPAYSFQKLSRTSGGNVDIRLNIKDGRIDQAKIYGDFFNKLDIGQIEEQLSGINHERGVIKRKLNEIKIENYFKNISAKEFLEALF